MNNIIDITSALSITADEPVTLAEFKAYAKHEWTDVSDWEIAENTIDTDLLIAAREIVENHIRQNIVLRDLVVTACLDSVFALPGGEVNGTVTYEDTDGNVIEPVSELGTTRRVINGLCGEVVISYQSGMATVPNALKTAIKAQALFMYDNRLINDLAPTLETYLKGFVNYDHY
jgi:hypothetical protein